MPENNDTNRELTFSVTILVIVLSVLFGANTVAVKTAFTGIGVFTSAGIRFSIAALIISCWAYFTKRPFKIKKDQFVHLALITIIFTFQLGIFYIGLSNTFASRATLIMNMQPFLVLIFAHFTISDDRINLKKVFSMLLGFTGVSILFSQGFNNEIQYGDFAVLITATLWAVNATYIKKVIDQFRSFQLVMYPMYFAGPLYLVIGFFVDDPSFSKMNLPIFGAMLYQTVVTASFGFIVWNSLLKTYKTTSVHSFVFIMPISGVISSHLILGEPLTSSIVIAMVFIISGIALLQYRFIGLKP